MNIIPKTTLLISAFLLHLVALHAASPQNVIILYTDDMGFGDLGANNPDSKIPTPNFDRLAAEGMRFTDGHSSSGICTPSRFAMLTGMHHWRRFHGITQSFSDTVFQPDDFTLAKMFKSKGYNTAAIGKWHLGWGFKDIMNENPKTTQTMMSWGKPMKTYAPSAFDWSKPVPRGPVDQGFDYYFGDGTINFAPYCFIENDRILEAPTAMMDTKLFKTIPEGRWEFRPGPMVDGWDPYKVLPTLTDKAVAWIDQQKREQPFFMYFAFPSPHAPIIPNDEYRGTSEAGPYGDFVFETDAMAGRILQALKRNGFAENTVVVFSSDNGPESYAFERYRNYSHLSAGELRGLKRDVWEGGHRVPFVIKWPGRVQAGSVSNETISQVDLAATFAAMLGYDLKSHEAIDSYDLSPVLDGEKLSEPLRLATVQNTNARCFGLRQGDWIFLNNNDGASREHPDWYMKENGYKNETTPGLLFNLREDPSQKVNLYDQYPERVAAMNELLESYRSGKGCAPHAN